MINGSCKLTKNTLQDLLYSKLEYTVCKIWDFRGSENTHDGLPDCNTV